MLAPNTINLSTLEWTLLGWRPYSWLYGRTMETNLDLRADIAPVPIRIPGSVQQALLDAGIIEDYNVGLNSRLCEWVEHRHWEISTVLPPIQTGPVVLKAEGLDHSGWILIDGSVAAEWSGSLVRHSFDLTEELADGQSHQLSIVFDTPPEEQGQIGFTSRTKHFKPRYNFSWDWCPRLVPIGVSDRLELQIGALDYVIGRLYTRLAEDDRTGTLELDIECFQPTEIVFQNQKRSLPAGEHQLQIEAQIEPWQPNGNGEPVLYDLAINDHITKVGFKRVQWLPCQDAPEGAEPWICEVNGKPTFLQGVNWTPLKMDYHGVAREQYAQMINLYKEMGCNVLRVWGGAFLEREDFYELCDEAGIMVWQEFPLSSAGPENNAPTDPSAIDYLASIAEDYIKRRRHHVSLLMWCGGNELQTNLEGKDGTGKPLDLSHPCLNRLSQIVKREDPERRFVPASASGPRFTAKRECFGQGLHHDVHGPWNAEGDWQEYWQSDDALFRSEVGMPGASDASLIKKYCGECDPLPVSHDNPYWQHLSSWWIQDKMAEGITLEDYCQKSQELQAEVLGWAAEKTKARFPGIGGMIIWMGHDCAPVPVNTSVIDFEGKPKPAYYALKKVFTGV